MYLSVYYTTTFPNADICRKIPMYVNMIDAIGRYFGQSVKVLALSNSERGVILFIWILVNKKESAEG
jgi:hypothetical protein